MVLIHLNLDSSLKDKISEIAKTNKFSHSRKDNIYEHDVIKKINILCDSLRFLQNLYFIEHKQDINIINKIKAEIHSFLIEIEYIAKQAFYFQSEIPNTNYGKYEFKKELNLFFTEHKDQINYIIDIVYELGKKVEQYDPNENQGYY